MSVQLYHRFHSYDPFTNGAASPVFGDVSSPTIAPMAHLSCTAARVDMDFFFEVWLKSELLPSDRRTRDVQRNIPIKPFQVLGKISTGKSVILWKLSESLDSFYYDPTPPTIASSIVLQGESTTRAMQPDKVTAFAKHFESIRHPAFKGANGREATHTAPSTKVHWRFFDH